MFNQLESQYLGVCDGLCTGASGGGGGEESSERVTGGPLHAEVGPMAVNTVWPQLDIQVLPGYGDPASLGIWRLQRCSPLGK